MANSPLVEFYLGKELDNRGRTIDDIWEWNDRKLEQVHDYIQWLFPLREGSVYNPASPLLTEDDIAEFKNNPELRKNLLRSFARLLEFYGFMASVDCATRTMIKSDNFDEKSRNWLTPCNHNFLRITRILKSLTILGCGPYAQAFLNALEEIYKSKVNADIIGKQTLNYWIRAVYFSS